MAESNNSSKNATINPSNNESKKLGNTTTNQNNQVDTSENTVKDKRVSLTVRPRTINDDGSTLSKRVKDILSEGGDLYKHFEKTYGIIFPYTPDIKGFGKTVNYEPIKIPHSNLEFNQYTGTTNNDLNISATFTSDTEDNALYLLATLWFLNSCSMSKFGKNEGDDAGLPPPVLYLSGYNNLIDNIPVVISKFSYDLSDKNHYVNINVGDELSYWLPTELSVNITLKVQPNLKKVYDQWSLKKYKSGELFKKNTKNPGNEYIPSGWTW